jgi:tetratricopeptide (TPR) repeat protein
MKKVVVLIALLCWGVGLALAQEFPLWGDLKPGTHAVGFKVEHQYDYSRAFGLKYDYEGKLNPNAAKRPIQISIWYPAKKMANGGVNTLVEDYVNLVATEINFGELTDEAKGRARQNFFRGAIQQGVSEEEIDELLQMKTMAVKDAAAEQGSFPLIVFAQGGNLSPPTNVILCEYLASHGYVVATSPSVGKDARQITPDFTGVDTQVSDLEFIIGFMNSFPNLDKNKLGLIGFSFGGNAIVDLQLRNMYADALVSLDGNEGFANGGAQLNQQSPYYNLAKMRVPFMRLSQAAGPNVPLDLSLYNAMKFNKKYLVTFPDLRHFDFTSLAMIEHLVPNFTGQPRGDTKLGYELVSQYVLNFMNGYLKNDPAGLAFLKNDPEKNGATAGFVTVAFEEGLKPVPIEAEFTNLLNSEGGVQKAAEIFEYTQKMAPGTILFQENPTNILGYQLMGNGRGKDAIEVFKMNNKAYPNSANTYDSLAEGYMNDGQLELAIQYYEKALEVVKTDVNSPFKQAIELNAPARIQQMKEQLAAAKKQ